MVDIEFMQSFDNWVWGLLILVLGALIWSFRAIRIHRFIRFLFLLRLILFSLCLILLSQPRLTIRKVENFPREWNLYFDNSLSMSYHQNFSLAALNNGIQELTREFNQRDLHLNSFYFNQDVHKLFTDPVITGDGASTDLGKVLTHIADLDPNFTSGAILVTDGQPTQGINPVQISENIAVPVFTIGIGDTTPMVDVAIHSLDVPTVAIKGDDLALSVFISSIGPLNDRINVILMDGDKPIGSKFITVHGQGSQQKVLFRFKPELLGINSFEIVTSSLEDEINVLNNRQKFQVTVLKDRYQVALVTGSPNFNTTILTNFLKNNTRVNLNHFLQAGSEFRPPLKQFWEAKYDLIIFENFPTSQLSSQWQRIFGRKLIAHRSSLAWIIGPDVKTRSGQGLYPFFHLKPFGDVLDPNKIFPWYFTEEFIDSPLGRGFTTADIPNENRLPPLKPGLQVESIHDDLKAYAYLSGPIELPLLMFGEKENLRSLIWTAPGFFGVHYKLTGSKYSTLATQIWDGMLGWLLRTSSSEKLYFRLNKEVYQQGEAIIITGNMAGQQVIDPSTTKAFIRIYRNEERMSSGELIYNFERQRWEGELWASKPGHYRYEIIIDDDTGSSTQNGDFSVSEGQIELNKVFVNRNSLNRISTNTGGLYFPWNLRFNLFDYLNKEETVSTKQIIIRFGEEYLVLISLFLLLVVEWIVRRFYGLQ